MEYYRGHNADYRTQHPEPTRQQRQRETKETTKKEGIACGRTKGDDLASGAGPAPKVLVYTIRVLPS